MLRNYEQMLKIQEKTTKRASPDREMLLNVRLYGQRLVADYLLGLFVEYMNFRYIKAQFDGIASFSGRARINASDDLHFAHSHV